MLEDVLPARDVARVVCRLNATFTGIYALLLGTITILEAADTMSLEGDAGRYARSFAIGAALWVVFFSLTLGLRSGARWVERAVGYATGALALVCAAIPLTGGHAGWWFVAAVQAAAALPLLLRKGSRERSTSASGRVQHGDANR